MYYRQSLLRTCFDPGPCLNEEICKDQYNQQVRETIADPDSSRQTIKTLYRITKHTATYTYIARIFNARKFRKCHWAIRYPKRGQHYSWYLTKSCRGRKKIRCKLVTGCYIARYSVCHRRSFKTAMMVTYLPHAMWWCSQRPMPSTKVPYARPSCFCAMTNFSQSSTYRRFSARLGSLEKHEKPMKTVWPTSISWTSN